ncbi:TPA: glycosyltransferase family 4 protein [Methanosarcina acetivorans]|uniref:Glycosyltransferase family 4 protein n=1 Tax=Methanosarcina acetivorans TaxID=2214 RepID=A0A832W9H6_9EURY|nr:glycosyltransferase family 4 protein [Methanosarcina acetivorans]HIH93275.1 glycosyltransferase family 4 protein [Methanosarcina acetivorans]
MRVLHVMPYIPFTISGAPVRDYNIIKKLSEKKIESQIICNYYNDNKFDNSMYNITQLEKELNGKIYTREIPDLSALKKIKTVLLDGMYPPFYRYNSPINIKTIESVLKKSNFDIIHAQHTIEAAPVIQAASNSHFEGAKVITLHNVDHLNFIRQINHQKSLLMRFAHKRVVSGFKAYELNILNEFDHIFVVSEVDRDIYISYGISKDKINVVPNGVNCDFYKIEIIENDMKLVHPNLLFMGNLTYPPNEFGIKNYLEHVHPLIKKKFQSIKLYIMGKNCPNWLNDYSKTDNSVEIIGFVEDVRPYISNSDVCIAPLMSGSGTRLKILEYMAMSKPVVSTTIGAEGLEISDNKDILIADEWPKFASLIISLLEDEELSSRIGMNARKLVEARYDWKKLTETQINVYKKLIAYNSSPN